MAYKVRHSPESKKDLVGILDYLTEVLFAPWAACRFSNELELCYQRLLENPMIYSFCEDDILAAKGFRRAPVMRYLVFYTVEEEQKIVRIHRIFHGARNYVELIES